MAHGHTKHAYVTAVDNALYGEGCKMHSPAVKYSTVRGFFVESALTPNNADEQTIWEAAFSAKTGRPCHLPKFEELELHNTTEE